MGLALIDGYNSMGFDFAKPRLRANMEKAMQEVSAGIQSFENMRQKFINEYSESYDIIHSRVRHLDKSFENQFSKPGARDIQAAALHSAVTAAQTRPAFGENPKGRGRTTRGRGTRRGRGGQ